MHEILLSNQDKSLKETFKVGNTIDGERKEPMRREGEGRADLEGERQRKLVIQAEKQSDGDSDGYSDGCTERSSTRRGDTERQLPKVSSQCYASVGERGYPLKHWACFLFQLYVQIQILSPKCGPGNEMKPSNRSQPLGHRKPE